MEKSTAEVWVKVMAILGYIGAGFAVLFGLFFLILGPFMSQLMTDAASLNTTPAASNAASPEIISAVFIVLGIVFLAWGIFNIFISRGLWKYREWARITYIVLLVLGFVWSLIYMIMLLFAGATAPNFPPGFMVITILIFVIALVIYGGLFYLFAINRDIKALFQSNQEKISTANARENKASGRTKKIIVKKKK